MRKIVFIAFLAVPALLFTGCEHLDNDIDRHGAGDPPFVSLDEVALLLSELDLGTEQLMEVSDAVSASSDNGYDEEYTMQDLFRTPGAGVGDSGLPAGAKKTKPGYRAPLKDIIREHLLSGRSKAAAVVCSRRSDDSLTLSVDEYIAALESSDIQIYWPFSEEWDGVTSPIITFDPCDGSETNIGYKVVTDGQGTRTVEEVVVDEKLASEHPVWVINRNDDAGYTSIEMLRKQDPEWGSGGSIVVKPRKPLVCPTVYGRMPCSSAAPAGRSCPDTESVDSPSVRTLILKDFTMLRNYDPWFAGASEFFVKLGSVEDFTASTEAELKLYNPAVTDFMIVVKRKYVGKPRPFNAVLVSDWTDQLDQCALMITEDDGGTRTSWKCSAIVKIASKSYGFEINLPFNTRDDIVWRGQLSRRYLEANDNITGHFGDVDLTFEIRESL